MSINLTYLMTQILVVLVLSNPIADLFPSYAQIVIFAIWILSLLNKKKLLNRCFTVSFISGFIFVMTLIRCALAMKIDLSYFSPMQAAIARYQFFTYAAIFPYILSLDRDKKKKLFNLAIMSITMTVIVSLYYVLFVDPQAIRNTQGVSYWGVGDFQLMYGIAILSGPFLMYIFNRKKRRDKYLLYLLSFLHMCCCVLLCNLVTSVVIMVISIVLAYLINTKQSITKLFLATMGLVCVCMKDVCANVLISIANKGIFYWSTNNKIYAIANVLLGKNENLDTISSRVRLTKISLDTFMKNPILGVNFENHVQGMIGGHAQWADDLARYGILGNILIWINYFYLAHYCILNCESRYTKKALISSWIAFIILGFLNPALSGPILMVLFLIIPCMDNYYASIMQAKCTNNREECNESISGQSVS